jgi:hypothetical protein
MGTFTERCTDWLRAAQAGWSATSEQRRAVFLGAFCTLLFAIVNWHNYMVDFVPLSLIPVALLRDGTVQLDSFRQYYESLPENQRYTFTVVNGHLYSIKPVFVSLLATPFFVPPVLVGVPAEKVEFWLGWGRLTAAALCGCAIAFCYLTARRYGSSSAALAFTVLLAFGTGIWTVVGQTLTYHAGALLCIAALCQVLRDFPLPPARAALAGLLAGAAVVMRLTPLALLFPLGLFLSMPGQVKGLKAWLAALGGIVLLPICNAALNSAVFGHWYKTGYDEEMHKWIGLENPAFWIHGMIGIAISPNAGLLPQSPFLLLAVIGAWQAWTKPDTQDRGLLRTYSLCLVAYAALFCCWHDWWGGLTFASRMLTEAYPMLLPLTMVGWKAVCMRRRMVILVIVAGVCAVVYQIIGVATFDRISNSNPPMMEWQPARHFYWLYVEQFGILSLFGAVSWTAVELAGVGLVAAVMLKRFAPESVASTMPARPNSERPYHVSDAEREKM